ncbi:MAG TPA: hypothetical protein VF857_10420 [Spirochaetota bacterium]
MHLMSDKIAMMIESHSEQITKRWLEEIHIDQALPSFDAARLELVRERVSNIIIHLREWISYDTTKDEIGRRYAKEGIEYFRKGIPLCEIVRSFELLKKIIWSFSINECTIDSAFELYQISELNERTIVFFDQAIYYIMRGYMEEMNILMKELWKLSDEDTEKVFFKKSFYNKKPSCS